MIRLPLTQVDAFATRAFEGNPAAVMPLDAWLPDATLQAIANENNLSETAFFVAAAPSDDTAEFDLRWFTPTVEVQLCGHATLASGHVVLSRETDRGVVRFRTRHAGVLTVERGELGYRLGLPAWAPVPSDDLRVAHALGAESRDCHQRAGGYSVVVLESEAAVRALRPNFGRLGAMGDVLAIATARGDRSDIVSRVFAPGAGIDEDPVTGSAHAILAPLWAARLGRDRFSAVQASARGGRLECELDGGTVWLGGGCVTVLEGVMTIPRP